MPSNMPEPAWKDSICWSCGRTFELNPDNMKFHHPTCDNCPAYLPVVTKDEEDDITAWIEMKEAEARKKRAEQQIVDEIEVIDPEEEN